MDRNYELNLFQKSIDPATTKSVTTPYKYDQFFSLLKFIKINVVLIGECSRFSITCITYVLYKLFMHGMVNARLTLYTNTIINVINGLLG